MKIHLVKNYNGTFSPADDQSQTWALKQKTGQVIHADFRKQRNYLFHKKYFGMLKMAFDNQDQYKNEDLMREAVQVSAGHYQMIYYLNGKTAIKAKSINFSSMKQEEFEKLYSAVLDVILAHFGFGEEFEIELIRQFG